MIQPQTYLAVADNTGAKKIMCIHVLGSNRRFAYLGDILIGVVKLCYFIIKCFVFEFLVCFPFY